METRVEYDIPEAIVVYTPDMLYESGYLYEAYCSFCPINQGWLIEEKEIKTNSQIIK